MEKYLHKPKPKNLIIFIIVVTVCILNNICFLLVKNNIITDNIDFLLFLHFLTIVSYFLIVLYSVNFILLSIEKAFSLLNNELQAKFFKFYTIADIIIGILLCVIWFLFGNPYLIEQKSGIYRELYIFLKESIYFSVLNTTEDLSSVYSLWLLMPGVSVLFCGIVFFYSAARKTKKKKFVIETIKQIELKEELNGKQIELKEKRNQELGFIYEESEFYEQVKIPYSKLNQQDGTRGEFEAYRVLVNSGLMDVEYLFNREIPKEDGLFTELDIIILHKNGIVVLENKDYSTRIFGKSTDDTLTIIDHSGKKISIYNPILQNKKHIMCLKTFLAEKGLYIDDNTTPIYSVVVFTDTISNKSDDIISGIEICDDSTKICTSQNLSYVVKNLLANNDKLNINISKIKELLSTLTIRKKY